jgi:mannose-6-phosphate isomerase-like protein (cupin superfamily)
MVEIRNAKKVKPYITKDKSEIRELFPTDDSNVKTMSLAEATISPDETTEYHLHKKSDEIYFVLEGSGVFEIEGEKKKVEKNDCMFIKAGSKHKIKNIGMAPLKILCFCSPPYSHEDTVLT